MAMANCPIELLKVRMQVQESGQAQKYKNVFDCARQIFAVSGIRGLYRGLTATLLRDVPSFAGYFGVYEGAKMMMRSDGQRNSPAQMFLAGGLAGLGARPLPQFLLVL